MTVAAGQSGVAPKARKSTPPVGAGSAPVQQQTPDELMLANTTLHHLQVKVGGVDESFAPFQAKALHVSKADVRSWLAANILTVKAPDAAPPNASSVIAPLLFPGVGALLLLHSWLVKLPLTARHAWPISLAVLALSLTALVVWLRKGRGGIMTVVSLIWIFVFAAIAPALVFFTAPSRHPSMLFNGLLLGAAILFAVFPGLLFFLFQRHHIQTLRQSFYTNVLRLSPKLRTTLDVRAKYDSLLSEMYGDDDGRDEPRWQRGTRAPIAVATLLCGLGWCLVLLPLPDLRPAWLLELSAPLGDPLKLVLSRVAYAFLGTYVFALLIVYRGHTRKDLHPTAYSHIGVRMLLATVLAGLLAVIDLVDANQPSALATSGSATALASVLSVPADTRFWAFAAGFAPDNMLHFLLEQIRRVPGLADTRPLTDLDGIDIYDRVRLDQEGITNVEALAHHDLVSLMLRTRIPAERLVDWVDQAILYLHVTTEPGSEQPSRVRLEALRALTIRTATDLEAAVKNSSDAERESVAQAVGGEAQLGILLRTLGDDEWLSQLRYWRNHDNDALRVISEPEELYSQ